MCIDDSAVLRLLALVFLLGVAPEVFGNDAFSSHANIQATVSGINGAPTDDCLVFADGWIRAIAEDSRGHLYVGGHFSHIAGIKANGVAMFDGTRWHSLGSGTDGFVTAIIIDSDDRVVVGGSFGAAGDEKANNVAVWDSQNWSSIGGGIGASIFALMQTEKGEIYAGGSTGAWRFTDGKWAKHGREIGLVLSLHSHNDVLIAGGQLFDFGNIARWEDGDWMPFPVGFDPLGMVRALRTTRHGELLAGGFFRKAGGEEVGSVAKWDGERWNTLGYEVNVNVLSLFEDEDAAIYAGVVPQDGPSIYRRTNVWSPVWEHAENDWAIHAIGRFQLGTMFAGGSQQSGVLGTLDGTCVSTAIQESGEQLSKQRWAVYPSPANSALTVDMNWQKLGNATAEIFDITGRRVKSMRLTGARSFVDVSAFPLGSI